MSPGEIVVHAGAGGLADGRADALAGLLAAAADPASGPGIYREWLMDQRSDLTRRAYDQAFRDFAGSLPAELTADEAAEAIARAPEAGRVNRLAASWVAAMASRGLRTNTIGRNVAALRSFCAFARRLGRVEWTLDVRAPSQETYRDVTGPGAEGWKRLIGYAASRRDGPEARRNVALLRLLFDEALRRDEALGLDLEHVDLEAGTALIREKKRTERRALELSPKTVAALRAWVELRGTQPGPLFVALDRASLARLEARIAAGEPSMPRLTGEALAKMVAALGRRAGLARKVRPHGLRHAAITVAAKAGEDLLAVQDFARHKDVKTTMRYIDHRDDNHGCIARILNEKDGLRPVGKGQGGGGE